MANSKTKKICVRVRGDHPTGSRNRAGFTFGMQPQNVEVTPEELKMIEEDQYLLIVKGGNALKQASDAQKNGSGGSDTGTGEKTTEELNEAFQETISNSSTDDLAVIKEKLENGTLEYPEGTDPAVCEEFLLEFFRKLEAGGEGGEGGEGDDDTDKELTADEIKAKLKEFEVEFPSRANKAAVTEILTAEVIKRLTEAEMKEGEDFNAEASVESLLALLENDSEEK